MTTYPLGQLIILYNISENIHLEQFKSLSYKDLEDFLIVKEFKIEHKIEKPSIKIFNGPTISKYLYHIVINIEGFITEIIRYTTDDK